MESSTAETDIQAKATKQVCMPLSRRPTVLCLAMATDFPVPVAAVLHSRCVLSAAMHEVP